MDSLAQEQRTLDQFILLLKAEQAALINADVDTLLKLSEQKLKLGDQLNLLARQRIASLKQDGVEPDAQGVSAWLTQQPSGVVMAWQQLMTDTREAHRLNTTNGKLIQTHLQHNQQAFAALMAAANQSSVYGPDGQTMLSDTPTHRSFGKG